MTYTLLGNLAFFMYLKPLFPWQDIFLTSTPVFLMAADYFCLCTASNNSTIISMHFQFFAVKANATVNVLLLSLCTQIRKAISWYTFWTMCGTWHSRAHLPVDVLRPHR